MAGSLVVQVITALASMGEAATFVIVGTVASDAGGLPVGGALEGGVVDGYHGKLFGSLEKFINIGRPEWMLNISSSMRFHCAIYSDYSKSHNFQEVRFFLHLNFGLLNYT